MMRKKENLVIVPGLVYFKKDFFLMIDFFDRIKNYRVFFFEADYTLGNEKNIDLLNAFLQENKISKTNFLTHSYGGILVKQLFNLRPDIVDKVVELGPPNRDLKIAKKCYRFFSFDPIYNQTYFDFVARQADIVALPNPPYLGVIAGKQRLRKKDFTYFVINLLINTKNSDGKVYIEETKTPNMTDFVIVHDNHTDIKFNSLVFELADNFFKHLRFAR